MKPLLSLRRRTRAMITPTQSADSRQEHGNPLTVIPALKSA